MTNAVMRLQRADRRKAKPPAAKLIESIDAVVASAARAEEHFLRVERRAENAVTALRQALGERGRDAAAGLLAELAEAHGELACIKAAATEAKSRLPSPDTRSA